ncbi:MAG: hypothetical protein NC111_05240 [Bacteroides sp.]|nr:hypothetical protein [Bacteroides sp.]MCM1413402.1 hypothetical protein [Bacteroides sp.]MCM1471912.1 hypothetical protein [Bacteroides sp.]
MGKKYKILGSGTEFYDDFGRNANDTCGIRLNGRDVERLSASGKWFTAGKVPEGTESLLWTENGRIVAIGADGKASETSVYLSATPGKHSLHDYEIKQESYSKSDRNEKKKDSDGGDSIAWKCFKGIFKGIWWLIKSLFVITLLASADNKNK